MSEYLVTVNIMGGLGNQMFQLATAYSYAKKYNGNLKILRNKYENDGRPLYWDTILKGFKKFLVDTIPSGLPEWKEKDATEYSIIEPLTKKGLYLRGYLQSPLYFSDLETQKEIKELFKPTDDLLNIIYNKYKLLIENKDRIVVLHARRTDYLRNQDIINFHGPLSVDYYLTAIKRFTEIVANPIFVLVSDDSSFWVSVINNSLELNTSNTYILDNENEINTFVLLQQFKYFAIANSTFSWWASWMSSNLKKVIAPSKWFGPTGPKNYKDLYMPYWELI
jgi:hypothetical protein